MTKEVNRWRVGDVQITRIIEFESGGFPPGFMFDGLTEEQVKLIDWLHPHYADPDGTIRYSVHSYVIESQGRRIIVDTCVGNDKPRGYEGWNHLHLPFLESLADAGFPAETIDIVLCTHLHMDHIGWNTRWDGEKWIPTFPNARYLFGRAEWAHWSQKDFSIGDMPSFIAELASLDAAIQDSVSPIVNAGLHEFIETNHQLTDEVSLFATPGHSPGHVSVAITSNGKKATITGDAILNPIQLADPEIGSNFDFDKALAKKTRQHFIHDHSDQDILVLGTHFTTPSGGYITTDGDTWRFVPALNGTGIK